MSGKQTIPSIGIWRIFGQNWFNDCIILWYLGAYIDPIVWFKFGLFMLPTSWRTKGCCFPFSELLAWMGCWFVAFILGPLHQFHTRNCVFYWCKLVFDVHLSLKSFMYYAYKHILISLQVPLLRWKRFAVVAAMCIFAVRAVIVQIAFYLHIQVMILCVAVFFPLCDSWFEIVFHWVISLSTFDIIKGGPLLVSSCIYVIWSYF